MDGEHGGVVTDTANFAQTLDTLKREGSNILVVGTETADAHTAACHRLLGESDRESRYRLFVTDDAAHVSARDVDATERTTRTITYSEQHRSMASTPDSSDSSSLGALGIELIETIDEFDDLADGLESSELRVCVDSLVPLLHEYSAEAVFRLLHMVTSRVEHVSGMGHYHLPLAPDHDAVHLLEPLFDAIVTVRSHGDRYEQRWRLRDRETTTDWLPL